MDGFLWDLLWAGVILIALVLAIRWVFRQLGRIVAALAAFLRSKAFRIGAIAAGAVFVVAVGAAVLIPSLFRARSSIDLPSVAEPPPQASDIEPPPASRPRPSPTVPVSSAPVYNATVSQRLPVAGTAPGPKVLAVPDRKENTATFWVGFPDPESDLPENSVPSPAVAGHVGSATVAFQCLACSDQQPREAEITLNGLESSRLRFPFLPDRRFTAHADGVGLLVFTVSVDSTPVDRVTMPLVVGSPADAAFAAYQVLASETGVTRMSQLERVERGIDLQLDFYTRDRYLAMDVKPVSARLRSGLISRAWNQFAMEGATVSFPGAMSEVTLENRLRETYLRLNALVRAPEKLELRQAISKITGSQPQVAHAAELTAAEQQKFVSFLASTGEGLFSIVAAGNPQAAPQASLQAFLADAIGIAAQFRATGRPLRIQVRNSTPYYVPWQLLYVGELSPTGSNANPDEFLGTLAEVAEDRVRITRVRPVPAISTSLSGQQILYGRWTANPDDHVSVRATNLHAVLRGLVQDPDRITVVTSRDGLLRVLGNPNHGLRLITIYAHGEADTALGGPVLKLNASEYVTPDQIRLAASGLRSQPSGTAMPVVILASCELGTGGEQAMDDDDFPATFLRVGSGAVVAPVSEIWASYADWFTRDVTAFLATGADIQSAVHRTTLKHLRERRNPAGLLFSVFGDPALRMTPQPPATASRT